MFENIASELNCSLLIVKSQNASFLILASDYPEDHTTKGKGVGITKIDGSGRKEGREGTEKTMVAAFILATYLEILYFWKKKKKLAERPGELFSLSKI